METDKNSISRLKEFHDRMKKQSDVSEPVYNCMSQVTSGFKAICMYRGYETEGTGSSKSIAKCEAAEKMLLKLNIPVPLKNENSSSGSFHSVSQRDGVSNRQNSNRASSLSFITDKLANDFLAKYSNSISNIVYPPSPADLEVCFSDIDFGMKSPNAPKSKILLERRDKEMHAIECFEKVMNEMGLKFQCEQAEVNSKATDVCVILLKINFNCMVVGGKGHSIGEAVEEACQNGLDTFRLYMK